MNPMTWFILGKVTLTRYSGTPGKGCLGGSGKNVAFPSPAPDSSPACLFDFADRLSSGPNGASHHLFKCLLFTTKLESIIEKHAIMTFLNQQE